MLGGFRRGDALNRVLVPLFRGQRIAGIVEHPDEFEGRMSPIRGEVLPPDEKGTDPDDETHDSARDQHREMLPYDPNRIEGGCSGWSMNRPLGRPGRIGVGGLRAHSGLDPRSGFCLGHLFIGSVFRRQQPSLLFSDL